MATFDPATVTNSFFEDPSQMGLSHRTRLAVAAEGIVDPGDLAESAKDNLKACFLTS